MDRSTILVVHLVELIDQAQTFVCQDEGTTLESPLTCDGIFVDTCGETDSAGTLACGVHTTVEDLLDVLEELRLGCAGVSQKQYVDVTTDPMLAVDVLGLATEHGQC